MTDLSLWQSASLPNTVDHVLERYHATHRRQLADATQLAEKVAARHENFPAQLVDLIQAIEAELSSHMMKEERMLFPMIKNGMGRCKPPITSPPPPKRAAAGNSFTPI